MTRPGKWRGPVGRIWDGSLPTLLGYFRWIAAEEDWGERVARVVIPLLGFGIVWVALGIRPIAALMILVWIIRAYLAGERAEAEQEATNPEAAAEPEEEAPELPEPPAPARRRASPAELRAWLAPRLHRLIGDGPGVWAETLLADLVADGLMPPDHNARQFHTDLRWAGIGLRPVHIGDAVRLGVHRQDLAALDALIAAATPPIAPPVP